MVTTTNVASAINKLVAADALPELMSNMVLANLALRDFDYAVAQPSDVVSTPFGKITLTSWAQSTFQVPDVTKVLAVPELLRLYMTPAILEIAQKIETNLYNATTAFEYMTGDFIKAADEAEKKLYSRGVNQKYLVAHPTEYGMLRQQESFSEYESVGAVGATGIYVDGSVGRWRDMLCFRSANVKDAVVFNRRALCMATRRLPRPIPGTGAIDDYAEYGNFGMRVVMNYQPNTLAQQFTLDVLYGVAVIDKNCGVRIGVEK